MINPGWETPSIWEMDNINWSWALQFKLHSNWTWIVVSKVSQVTKLAITYSRSRWYMLSCWYCQLCRLDKRKDNHSIISEDFTVTIISAATRNEKLLVSPTSKPTYFNWAANEVGQDDICPGFTLFCFFFVISTEWNPVYVAGHKAAEW